MIFFENLLCCCSFWHSYRVNCLGKELKLQQSICIRVLCHILSANFQYRYTKWVFWFWTQTKKNFDFIKKYYLSSGLFKTSKEFVEIGASDEFLTIYMRNVVADLQMPILLPFWWLDTQNQKWSRHKYTKLKQVVF